MLHIPDEHPLVSKFGAKKINNTVAYTIGKNKIYNPGT